MTTNCNTCKLYNKSCVSCHPLYRENYDPYHCCETCDKVACEHPGKYSFKAIDLNISECDVWHPVDYMNLPRKEPGPKMQQRGASLSRALAIINGERQDSYGAPEDSFRIIAEFWETYMKHRADGPLTPMDVARMMSLMKHARMLGQTDKADNYDDACGYMGIAGDIMRGEK